jgi:hypothetical protein
MGRRPLNDLKLLEDRTIVNRKGGASPASHTASPGLGHYGARAARPLRPLVAAANAA